MTPEQEAEGIRRYTTSTPCPDCGCHPADARFCPNCDSPYCPCGYAMDEGDVWQYPVPQGEQAQRDIGY